MKSKMSPDRGIQIETIEKNHACVYTPNGAYLQSFNTILAWKRRDGQNLRVVIDKHAYNHTLSVTSKKHLSRFFAKPFRYIRAHVEKREYELGELN